MLWIESIYCSFFVNSLKKWKICRVHMSQLLDEHELKTVLEVGRWIMKFFLFYIAYLSNV